ncbi:competence protein CoiA family protein (plasmid) [Streptomyces sp. NBC_01216]|uniref:competence protein CoiA family protein n=1 Tax=Streptomyces sp. NBC_01216 TaxID=2903778 RepID=UPI002E14B678|nr:competence protein CoiA family protein [Streptomyces sp. NBC_01216]
MGFTAQHDGRGRLDATQYDLGCGWAWEAVHRTRPRVIMVCPECAHPMHAKVSRYGLRFFAHDPGAPTCALAGESMEHHLLKLELATAVRAAGYHAELEIRGPDGDWRADVMSTSPDGTARMAWEAQLSPITVDEISERTARFAKDGVRVCWVATKLRPWVGEVPSVHVRPPSDDEPNWTVAGGLARFTVDRCEEHVLCRSIGHGEWHETTANLRPFTAWALTGRAVSHRLPSWLHTEQHAWTGVWTAPQYITAAAAYQQAHDRAVAAFEEQQRLRENEQRRRREAEYRARRARQLAAPAPAAPPSEPADRQPTVPQQASPTAPHPEPTWQVNLPNREREHLHAAALAEARLLLGANAELRYRDGDRRWALGTPLYAGDRPCAVLRPRPQLVDWDQLKGLIIFVRNLDELRILGRTAPNGTRIIILPEQEPRSQ